MSDAEIQLSPDVERLYDVVSELEGVTGDLTMGAERIHLLTGAVYRALEIANSVSLNLENERAHHNKTKEVNEHNLKICKYQQQALSVVNTEKERIQQKLNAATQLVNASPKPWLGKTRRYLDAERMWEISKNVDKRFFETDFLTLHKRLMAESEASSGIT